MADSTPQNGTPVNSSTPASSTPSSSTPAANGAASTPPQNGDPVVDQAKPASEPNQNASYTKNVLSNGDLPWAVVLLPTTASGVGGVGESKHHLQVGDWVFGFFADGDSCQQPVIVGVIPGGAGGGSGSFGGNGSPSTPSSGDDIPAANIPQNEAQKIVYQKLRAIGFTHVQAAGIMGNIQQESNFRLSAAGDSGSAHGICQWRGDRWANLKAYAAAKGKSYNDLETQVEFIKHEMEKYPRATGYAMTLLNTAKTAEEAARAFCNFEKPRGYRWLGVGRDGTAKADGISNRISYAKTFDKRFAGQGKPETLPKPEAGV